MSQSNKISNIIFSLILIIIIAGGVTFTYFAIKKHHASVTPPEEPPKVEEEPPPNYFTFKEVEEANTIDVFKEYPINPITINFDSTYVTIDGLKDEAIESKVNELLRVLDRSENQYGNNQCSVDFNVSNVLAITCKGVTKNINLTTGEEIILEEIFQKDSDIYSILWDGLYKSYCSWYSCYPDSEYDEEYPNQVENYLAKTFNEIKNGDYDFSIAYLSTGLSLINSEIGSYIDYSKIASDVTIYDRFLTDKSIFEYKVNEYCNPMNCFQKTREQAEDYYVESYFLTDRVYLNIYINNMTNYNLENENIEEQILDLEVLKSKIIDELVFTYNINTPIKNYKEVDISARIYASTDTYNQVINSITINEYTKENFEKKLLGDYETKTISNEEINTVNMTISFTNEISNLPDEPNTVFANFENTLYEYITNDIDLRGNNSPFYSFKYNMCEFEDDYETCMETVSYYDLIRDASYSIDLENNRLYIYHIKKEDFCDYYAPITETLIPTSIFALI